MNTTPDPAMNATPRRILVVDDNQMNGHLAQVVLTRAGFVANVVESASLALDYLCGNRVDVILSDVSMPGMSGKDLCREVRSRYKDASPRMVAYTAFAMEHQREGILAAGFDALLVKPASSDAIVAAVVGAPRSA